MDSCWLALLCYLGEVFVWPEGRAGGAGLAASSDWVFLSAADSVFEHHADFFLVGRAVAALGEKVCEDEGDVSASDLDGTFWGGGPGGACVLT